MDLEKEYDRMEREALWSVLQLYGVVGQLLEGVRAFYRDASECVRVHAVEIGYLRTAYGVTRWEGESN